MKFSPDFIQEVIDRTDIQALVGRYVSLKRAGANYTARCPFHSEKTPSFSVSPSKKMFYCFGCHAGGSAITFVQKIENLEFPEAVEFLAKEVGMNLPQESEITNSSGVSRKKVLEMNLEAAKFFRACLLDPKVGSEGLNYLKNKRKLTDETIKHFGLGFAPNTFDSLVNYLRGKGYSDEEMDVAYLGRRSDKTQKMYDLYRNRVMFPIFDVSGNIIAFGGRVMDDSKPKYLHTSDTPAFRKNNHLYALNYAKNHCKENIILCEGYMDVIALHAAGFPIAVATLGTALTSNQARILSKYSDKIILSYDADEAGQNATKKAIQILGEVGLESRILKIEGAKDPDEFIRVNGPEAFRAVLNGSKTSFEFQIDKIFSEYDITEGSGRIKATNAVCNEIAGYHAPVEREVYIDIASKRLGLPQETIRSTVEGIRKNRQNEYQKQTKRDAEISIRNYGDTINPDATKNPRAAATEKIIIGILLLRPEYRDGVEKGTYSLKEEDFVTDFYKRVFHEIMRMQHESEFCFELLGETFNTDEMGRIQQCEMERVEMTNNESVFVSLVDTLKNCKDDKDTQSMSLTERLEYLRNKNKKKES